VSDDVKRRLETMRICTDGPVETLIVHWLTQGIANHLLSKDPGLFSRPYYNTPLVPMLRAHADEQIVRIYAFLCGSPLCKTCRAAGKKQKTCVEARCQKPITHGIAIRGLDHLKNHRDVLGHPLTWHLDRAGVRRFVDSKRDRNDVRPALIWDIHRSIVEAQVAAGVSATVLDLKISPYHTEVLDSVLRLCLRPEVPAAPDAVLTEYMNALWKKTRVWFEKHPDGQVPRKTDAEFAAIYDKMKKAWYASRG